MGRVSGNGGPSTSWQRSPNTIAAAQASLPFAAGAGFPGGVSGRTLPTGAPWRLRAGAGVQDAVSPAKPDELVSCWGIVAMT
jgi:hypothetical protein